jgi:hypothetical protein
LRADRDGRDGARNGEQNGRRESARRIDHRIIPPVKAEPITPIGIGEVSVGNGFKSSSA